MESKPTLRIQGVTDDLYAEIGKIKELESKVATLLDMFNIFVLKKEGVAMMWYDEYCDAMELLEKEAEGDTEAA